MYSLQIKHVKMVLVGLVLAFLSQGCTEGTNFNQIFVSKAQKNSLVSLIERAQLAYDKGEFSDALELAEKAETLSPHNEEIGVLLAYIHLGLTGMDSFRITEALMEATEKEKAQNASAGLATTHNSTATILFSTLLEKMNISKDDLASLGEFKDDDDLSVYKNYPVIIPDSASASRASALNVFTQINAAIEKICPFVDADVRVASDARHADEVCVATEVRRERSVIAHFLWAFAHIVDAAMFYSVVQYQDAGNDQPNIKMRADALDAQKAKLSLSEYAAHAVSLASSVTSIYDFVDTDSSFNAIVGDLTAVGLAFSKIGSMPAKVRKSLDKTVSIINDTSGVAGSDENQKKANALKAELNKKMTVQVADKINAAAKDNPDEFNANKSELCDAYNTISGSGTPLDSCK